MSKGKNRIGVIYSTKQDFEYDEDSIEAQETLPPHDQTLYVSIDRKHRKGKIVTLISNFIGTDNDLETLAKELKKKCGTGGSAKDNEIIIQGEKRDAVLKHLDNLGYKTKSKGG